MTLDDGALSRLKVKDLQRELKKRGLDTAGLKAVLLQRLKEHLQDEENEEEKPEQKEEEINKSSDKETKDKKDEAAVDTASNGEEHEAETNAEKAVDNSETTKGVKRAADVENVKEKDLPDTKKQKTEEASKPEPEDEDGDKPMAAADSVNSEKADEDSAETEKEERTTLRIDNFVRPFTLNAVKALVQEFGNYVEGGFWMDAIKTHCFVTYPSSETTEKTRAALDGKAWPPENGRSLSAKLVDFTAMEVSQYGEENIPSRLKSKDSRNTQATQRQKVTIDEFFQKTETKPVLYYLPLTDEQVEEKKKLRSQQPEGQPRKRRHRGGRKRNRRARFRR
ncbi:hypothetical protein V7S43_002816 [Phytophthora oleae]|uniref:SAP domain-containing protein n=1 Tax=Phytophthora oleae TaxID=2107226 RepID=A0ABD3FZ07_9STRA